MPELNVTSEEAYETLLDAASETVLAEELSHLYAIEFAHINAKGETETETVWVGIDEDLAHEWVVEKYNHWLSVYEVNAGKFTIVYGEVNSDELSIHWTYVCLDGDLFKWVA